MSKSTSNDNGRALEYALTQAIIRNTPNARVDYFTNQNQMRDLAKLQQLPRNIQSYFIENTDYFSSIILPTSMSASLCDSSYRNLDFNNGFSFRMRLHTASSRFEEGKSLSLKFGTHLQTENIPSSTYNI